MQYALRWTEANRKGEIVAKQKEFATMGARIKFADRLEKKDNFIEILAWSDR